MKPSIYWESLNTEERDALAASTGKSKKQLFNIFNRVSYASMTMAVDIAKHCEGMIDPLDLISPDNREAVKVISGHK